MSGHAAIYTLSHMELLVEDMERSVAFYTGVLDLVVTDEGGTGERRMVFLSRNPEEHHQLVLCSGREPGAGRGGFDHLSFRVADLAALRGVLERLRAAPHGPVEQVTHGISWSVYFRDPDGHRLEAFVDTPWYTPQPLREPLDYAQTDDAVRAATEALVRGRPGFQTREAWRRGFEARLVQRAGTT